MSTKALHRHATRLQDMLLRAGLSKAPAVVLDAWSSILAWHEAGEPWWRITAEHAERLLDEPLAPDLLLETAPTRGKAMAYQLPERGDWIILAQHSALAPIVVKHPDYMSYRAPTLTYCTELDPTTLASGRISLVDMPTPDRMQLTPGVSLLRGALTDAEISEEDYRVALAIAQHYRP